MKKKITILIILLMIIVIPVFATNYNEYILTVDNILYPNTSIEEFNELPMEIYYCDLNDNCHQTYDEKTHIYSLEEYNNNFQNDKIDEKVNNKQFKGWKVTKVVDSTSSSGLVKAIYLSPYYDNEHKIIKKPTTKNPTVEVTEEDEVEEYRWYVIDEEAPLRKFYIDNGHGTGPLKYFSENVWNYNKDTNTYSTDVKSIFDYNQKLKGYMETTKESKVTITYQKDNYNSYLITGEFSLPQQKSYGYTPYYSIGEDAFKNPNSILNPTKNCNEETKICIETYDLSNLDEKEKYTLQFTIKGTYDTSVVGSEITVKFENVKVYTNSFNILENETTKTLSKKEIKNEFFVLVKYKDGTVLIANNAKNDEEAPEQAISKEISDIVANPLTGDNIIYTIAICLISMSSLVILSVTLKKIYKFKN